MLGYDVRWAAFQVIEVMSQQRFAYKRIAALLASQTFDKETDVLVLCTQLLRKEFQATSQYEVGLAINSFSNMVTRDLGQQLLPDLSKMLTSSKPYIRKKSTLALFKVYKQYPEALQQSFEDLTRRLEDENPSVVSCAVNVVCELSRKRPENYVVLAPKLFNILKTSQNNWMLIKVTKLFGSLVSKEPRLARKLLEPLAHLVETTGAKSLTYECVFTLTKALQYTRRPDGTDAKNAPAVVRLCADTLREFITNPDQNLKYLGLVGLVELMKSHPRVVSEHRQLVVDCLGDEDVTIRLRALELLVGMVTKRNLQEIVHKLMEHVDTAEGAYKDELIKKVIYMCSHDSYACLEDFAWYLSILRKLSYVPDNSHGESIASQMLDVCVRVDEIRDYAVKTFAPLLQDPSLSATTDTSSGPILIAAAYIVGEYAECMDEEMLQPMVDALLQPRSSRLPAAVQAAYIQCVLKIYRQIASFTRQKDDSKRQEFVQFSSTVVERLHTFAQSPHVEVQERAVTTQQILATSHIPYKPLPSKRQEEEERQKREAELLAMVEGNEEENEEDPEEPDVGEVSDFLNELFSETLKRVHPKAQKKVPLPEGLDLDQWIDPDEQKQAENDSDLEIFSYKHINFSESYGIYDDETEGQEADLNFYGSDDEGLFEDLMNRGKKSSKKKKKKSKAPHQDPFLLSSKSKRSSTSSRRLEEDDEIPIQNISLDEHDSSRKKRRDSRSSSSASENDKKPKYRVREDIDIPEGANLSDSDESEEEEVDPLAKIDLSQVGKESSATSRSGRGRRRREKGSEKTEKSKKKTKTRSEKKEKPKEKKSKKVREEEPTVAYTEAKPKESEGAAGEQYNPISDRKPMTMFEDDNVKVSVVIDVQNKKPASVSGLFVCEGKSKKKVQYVDISFPDKLARLAGLPSGNNPGSVRIAQNVKYVSISTHNRQQARVNVYIVLLVLQAEKERQQSK